MQRIVIGRGAGSDVRLPDPSVSHRHASIRPHGADFVVVDESSTNGTFVGEVRVAPQTSRLIRSGDVLRLGRIYIEVRIEQRAVTRDVAAATRDLALALVARAMAAAGEDRTPRVRVVEGPDQGVVLMLSEEDRGYVFGRAAGCDVALSDPDASRDHLAVVRRPGGVFVRDLGAKNGSWLGEMRVPPAQEALWRPSLMIRIGRTVLALDEPLGEALARLESAPDDQVVASDVPPPAPAPERESPGDRAGGPPASGAESPGALEHPVSDVGASRGRWSAADFAVMTVALGILTLSLAGLVWLLRS
jgi:pSer/pThr/pTyr-binding forkhead associated (FHA) protein